MAVSSDDHGVRFIQISLGDMGVTRDLLDIVGFEEARAEGKERIFLKSWKDFHRTNEKSTDDES